jgi:hypothetical protein
MLLYDIAYLAHTQAVDVPLAGVGDALGNLWQVCCAPELGRRSHESGAPAPGPSSVPVPGGGTGTSSTAEGAMPGMGALLASELGVGHGLGPGIVTAPSLGIGTRVPPPPALNVPRVLPPPTPPTFPLDFAQVLQATAAGPRRVHRDGRTSSSKRDKEKEREKDKKKGKENVIAEEDDWDIVDVDEDRDAFG